MEVVFMQSEKGKKLLVVNNYKFCIANVLKNGTVRWRCTNKTSKCPAKIYTSAGNEILDSELSHNHKEDINLHRQIVNNSVKRKALENVHEKPAKLVHTELRSNPGISSNITTYDMELVRHNIWMCRRKLTPNLPKTQKDVFEAVNTLAPMTDKEESFVLTNNADQGIIIFAPYSNLYFLCCTETVYMDGTFDFCPKFFTQLFTIHGYKNGHYVPLVFCLLPDKKQSTYQTCLNMLCQKCSESDLQFYPKSVVIDFETAIHNAIMDTWEEARVSGCRFHLSQAWYRKIHSLGLSQDYKNHTEVGKMLRYCFGLQFLDCDEVGDAFAFDLIPIMPKHSKLQEFCDYLVDNYISENAKFTPNIWASSSASSCRTTNACESFHSRFNKSFYSPHPNIFQFVDSLLNFQSEVYVKINTSNKFQKVVRRTVKLKQDYLEVKINNYKQNLIDRLTFIKSVSFKYAPNM